MAVYKFNGGAFQRVGEDLGEMVPAHLLSSTELHGVMSEAGFLLSDDIDDAVSIYRRAPVAGGVHYLPGVRWVFDVSVDGEAIDSVLVGDSLPDYLALLGLLQPLITRRRELAAEVSAELN